MLSFKITRPSSPRSGNGGICIAKEFCQEIKNNFHLVPRDGPLFTLHGNFILFVRPENRYRARKQMQKSSVMSGKR